MGPEFILQEWILRALPWRGSQHFSQLMIKKGLSMENRERAQGEMGFEPYPSVSMGSLIGQDQAIGPGEGSRIFFPQQIGHL